MALDHVKAKEPIMEIVEDQDEDGLEALVKSVVDNKASGYRRSNPSAAAEIVKEPTNKSPNNDPHKETTQTQVESPNIEKVRSPSQKVRYCHFFSNFGYCKFEEEQGRKCKFIHKKAPICKYDGKCNREKCMFSHTKKQAINMSSQRPFLPQGPPQWRGLPHHPLPPPAWVLQGMWNSMVNEPHF